MKAYSKTILYVEDDADDIAILRYAIEIVDPEHQLVEANDGIQALELLRQMQEQDKLPCLIILDINMPRMDGKQTLIALQSNAAYSSIPIVFFSTSSSAMDNGFSKQRNVALITKPFDFKSLYITANRLLSYCLV